MSQSPLNAPGNNGRRNEAGEADEEDGILEYVSSCSEDLDDESFSTNNEEADDEVGGIPSLDREAAVCLERFHISEIAFVRNLNPYRLFFQTLIVRFGYR